MSEPADLSGPDPKRWRVSLGRLLAHLPGRFSSGDERAGAIRLLRKALRVLEYGVPIRHQNRLELSRNGLLDGLAPIFVLSTGRCGTLTLTHLLEEDRGLKLLHSPEPELVEEGRVVWELLAGSSPPGPGDPTWRALEALFLAARGDHLLRAHNAGLRLVETNNKITFFAPIVAPLLPGSSFVHLHRHPGEFVRSGIRRGWYEGHGYDVGRLVPPEDVMPPARWDAAGPIERIGWLWEATNAFIDSFKAAIDPRRVHTVSLNRLEGAAVQDLVAFVGARLSDDHVQGLLSAPVKPNAQTTGSFPPYHAWTEAQRQQLRDACGDRAARYGYDL